MDKKILILFIVFLIIPFTFAESGTMKLLAVSKTGENETGSLADLYLDVQPGSGRIFIDSFPLTKLDTQISTRFANEVACDFLDKDCSKYDFFYTIRASSNIIGGPSAGAAISILTISVLSHTALDEGTVITGTINSGGYIGTVGGILAKVSAAKDNGYNKVLIPKWSIINDTNLTILAGDEIDVIRVSSLNDALYEFTGKRFKEDKALLVSSNYLNTMKNISVDLCERTDSLVTDQYENNSKQEAGLELYEKGKQSLARDKFYASASFCFGANVQFRQLRLLMKNMSAEEILSDIEMTRDKVVELRKFINAKEMRTITDLQTYMITDERLVAADDYLDQAELYLNFTNISVYNLGFAMERLYSAYSWSSFFGREGKEFILNKENLKNSCLEKLSEVEERIEYLNLYLPIDNDELRKDLDHAYLDYELGDYDLCLFKASKVKSEINLLLNSFGIEENQLDQYIDERIMAVEQVIAEQEENDVFPILGYSYYEYAKELREEDMYSALLYLEYAIELSKLDLYFDQDRFVFPYININYVYFFAWGCFVGSIVCFYWMKKKFIK